MITRHTWFSLLIQSTHLIFSSSPFKITYISEMVHEAMKIIIMTEQQFV